MGRKEKYIDGTAGPVAEFALALRKVRQEAGNPTYRRMAETVHFSAPALSKAASGKRLPTWPVAEAYLRACGVTNLKPWEDDWNITDALFRVNTKPKKSRDGSSSPSAVTVSAEQVRLGGVATRKRHLLATLDEIRTSKRMSLRAVAARSQDIQAEAAAAGRKMPSLSCTTIHEVLSGRRRLDDDFIRLYLLAVDASAEQQYQVGLTFGLLDRETQSTIDAVDDGEGPTLPATELPPLPRRVSRRRAMEQAGEPKRHVGRAAVVRVSTHDTPVPRPEVEMRGAHISHPPGGSAALSYAQPTAAERTGNQPRSHRDVEPRLTVLDDSYVDLDRPVRLTGQRLDRRLDPSFQIEPVSRIRCHRTKAGDHGERGPYLVRWPTAAQRRLLLVLASTVVLAGLGLCLQGLMAAPMRILAAAPDFPAHLLIAVGMLLGMADVVLLVALRPFDIQLGWLRRAVISKWKHSTMSIGHPGKRSRPLLLRVRGPRRRGTLLISEVSGALSQLVISGLLSWNRRPAPIADPCAAVVIHRRPTQMGRCLSETVDLTRAICKAIGSGLAQITACRPQGRLMLSTRRVWNRLALTAGVAAAALVGFAIMSGAQSSPAAIWIAPDPAHLEPASQTAPECLRITRVAQTLDQHGLAPERGCWQTSERVRRPVRYSPPYSYGQPLASSSAVTNPDACTDVSSDDQGCADPAPRSRPREASHAGKSLNPFDPEGAAPVWPDEMSQ